MKINKAVLLTVFISLILINAGLVFSQEQAAPQPNSTPEMQAESETQWLWGEVISIDPIKNELLVKYLDYENDQEKEVTVATDEKTTFENANGLSDIKPQDTISVDYVLSGDGKYLAKNISLEKPQNTEKPQEPAVAEPAPASQETAGQQAQPAPAPEVVPEANTQPEANQQ